VDRREHDRIDEAQQELHWIINDREMKDAIILIFFKTQDLIDAMTLRSATKCWNRQAPTVRLSTQ